MCWLRDYSSYHKQRIEMHPHKELWTRETVKDASSSCCHQYCWSMMILASFTLINGVPLSMARCRDTLILAALSGKTFRQSGQLILRSMKFPSPCVCSTVGSLTIVTRAQMWAGISQYSNQSTELFHLFRQSWQYECPHGVTRGFCKIPRQMLQSAIVNTGNWVYNERYNPWLALNIVSPSHCVSPRSWSDCVENFRATQCEIG